MKFSNGFWLTKAGVSVHSPAQAYEIKIQADSITVLAPCSRITGRGDTLQGPVLTVKLSSPAPGIIHVQAYHFKGATQKGPHFELSDKLQADPTVIEDEESVSLTSGNLSVRVQKNGGWKMDFLCEDKVITSSGFRHMAYILDENKQPFMREQLDLSVGEYVYGLGERFSPFVKNGQVVDIWNEDGGTCSEQAYKNIPFYITNKGYGVLVNHPEKVSFEVASEVVSRVSFSVEGECLDYFVIGGPTMKEVLQNYTLLTGKPALPPAWSFGLWLSTSFTTNYDEQTVSSFVDGMAERNLPLQVFHFDCFWMKEFNWCDFKWDSRVFPDPQGMLARLKAKGLHICVWINPYIAQESSLFDEGVENGYFIKRTDGSVWQWDLWQPGMAIVDFTNTEACKWFAKKLSALQEMGVDCFKTDFGERIPAEGVVYHDGSDPKKMHNFYTYLYNKTVFEALRSKRGKNEAVVFARSATVGSQKFPVHWGGDCTAEYVSMAETLRGGLSLGLSGFGFWSHDIGGFENTAPPDLYKRWVAFGLLSSHSRLHGSQSYRVPWNFDEESVDVLRFFTNLKCRLMPYLYKTAVETAQSGVSTLRAMVVEFQNDPACATLDLQYMLGDSLLVAPVFTASGDIDFYLPKGVWTNLLTGEKVQGGSYRRENHGFLSLPLYLRPNTLIAWGAENKDADYDYADHLTFLLPELEEGMEASTDVYDSKGNLELKAKAVRDGDLVTFSVEHFRPFGAKPWRVNLLGGEMVGEIKNAQIQKAQNGLLFVPEGKAETISFKL